MKLKLLNGNNQFYITEHDLTVILKFNPNNTWLETVKKETGLTFKKHNFRDDWLVTKPKNAMQVLKLLTDASTYNFIIGYTNNWSANSTIYIGIQDRPQHE